MTFYLLRQRLLLLFLCLLFPVALSAGNGSSLNVVILGDSNTWLGGEYCTANKVGRGGLSIAFVPPPVGAMPAAVPLGPTPPPRVTTCARTPNASLTTMWCSIKSNA